MEGFCTKAELAKELGLAVHILNYWLQKWAIDETTRVAGAKVYDIPKVLEIKKLVETARAVKSFSSQRCPQKDV